MLPDDVVEESEALIEILEEAKMWDVAAACRMALHELEAEYGPTVTGISERQILAKVSSDDHGRDDRLAVVVGVIRTLVEVPGSAGGAGVTLLRGALSLQGVAVEEPDERAEEAWWVPDGGAAEALHDALKALWEVERRSTRLAQPPFAAERE